RHIDLLEEALAAVPAEATGLRSVLVSRLSIGCATPETTGTTRRMAAEALALARESGDPVLVANALAAVCDAHGAPEHVELRRAPAGAVLGAAESAGERALTLLGRRLLIVPLLELGEFAALDRQIALFAHDAEALHQPLLSWYVPLFHGMRALLRGDL